MPGGLGAWGLGPGRWGAGGPFRGNGSGNREIWWTGTRVHFFFVPFPPSPVRRTSPIGNSSLITAKKKKDLENSEHPSARPHWDTRIAGQTIQTTIFQPAQLNSCSSSTTSRAHLPQPLQPSRRCVLRLGSLPTATPCPSSMSPVDGSHPPILPSSHPPDRRHATTTAGSVSAQPPNLLCRLPSAVCPSLPGHRQPGTALRHACTFCTSTTDDAHHNEQDLLQTDPADVWEGFRPDTRAPRRYSQCNTRVNDLSREGPDWLHTHTHHRLQ